VLGVFTHWPYEEQELRIGPGDRLLMYTDGITESRNADGEEFGEDRLEELASRTLDKDAAALTQAVISAAAQFSNGHFDDDLTVVAVSID
jgi:sigma-B regulation protein RsbU (phosphoserine phosphatase)